MWGGEGEVCGVVCIGRGQETGEHCKEEMGDQV